jgi:prepilin signal peptidase PulO-like enzyme (type II secretory pathway)
MDALLLVFIFIFGAIIGSFLNVVALRYNTGMTIEGRSVCFSCGKTLRWYELIPVLSYVMLRGKCSACRSGISLQYPLVELLTGTLFVLLYAQNNPLYYFTLMCLITAVLVVIVVYDIRHTIIPDGLVYSFIALSFIKLLSDNNFLGLFTSERIWELLAGPILFLPFFLLWFFSRGRWMGFGDAKLAWGIGWMLGLIPGISSLIFSFWIGALVGILMLLLKRISSSLSVHNRGLFLRFKNLTIKSEIPFAPFLILGVYIVFLGHVLVFDVTEKLLGILF